jgi:hypothetical protein
LPQVLPPEQDLDFVGIDDDAIDDLPDQFDGLQAIFGGAKGRREPSSREEQLLDHVGFVFRSADFGVIAAPFLLNA